MKITDDAMLEALSSIMAEQKRADEGGDGGVPLSELRKRLGIGDAAARRFVREAIESGQLIQGRRRILAIDGVRRWQSVYRPSVEVRVK